MFWVMLFRATFAVVIGVTLWLSPDFARPKMAIFMGMYWLMLGATNFRALRRGDKPGRLLMTAGLVAGLVTGGAVLVHTVAFPAGEALVFTRFVGGVISVTGMLHFLGGFSNYEGTLPRWRPGQALGVVEIVLGSILMLAPLSEPTYWAGSLWALLAGAFLLLEAHGRRSQPQPSGSSSAI